MTDIESLERELAEAKTRIADLQNEVKFLRDLIVIMTPSTKPNTDTPTPSLPPTTSWTGLGGSHC